MNPRLLFTLIVAVGAGVGALSLALILGDREPIVVLAVATGIGAAIGAWLIWPRISKRQGGR